LTSKGWEAAGAPRTEDADLVARLRAGDEGAFSTLVNSLHGRLLALARTIAPSEAVAEEAVQETWLAVIKGVHRFEGRSALSTWVFSILVNRARSISTRERRTERLTSESEGAAELEPGMGPKGRWEEMPVTWGLEDPESAMLSRETLAAVEEALNNLPPAQRMVVLIRDVEGLSAEDACNILGITETNQRVLLHRARVRVRRAVDRYMKEGSTSPSPARAPTKRDESS
jgi:RNA polymerase sigma-70 factor (ECF subfamily)